MSINKQLNNHFNPKENRKGKEEFKGITAINDQKNKRLTRKKIVRDRGVNRNGQEVTVRETKHLNHKVNRNKQFY